MPKEFDFDKEFENMMTSNKLDTVVLLGHINPDGDAAGSVMGLAHYIKVNYPQYEVLPYLADTIDKGPNKIIKTDEVFNPFEKPNVEGKKFAVIVCDNAVIVRMAGMHLMKDMETLIIRKFQKPVQRMFFIYWIKIV